MIIRVRWTENGVSGETTIEVKDSHIFDVVIAPTEKKVK